MALETLGACCAVGQLAGQCVYVLDTVGKLRRSTETLKQYQTQIQDVRGLCETIKQNPLLQTKEIISHTQSILNTTQQQDSLTLLLQKRRLYRVWAFLRVERQLVEQTKNIETLKSTLAISIQDQQCRILNDIDKRTEKSTKMSTSMSLCSHDNAPAWGTTLQGRSWNEATSDGEIEVLARHEQGGQSTDHAYTPMEIDSPPEGQPGEPTSQDLPETLEKSVPASGHHNKTSSWIGNSAGAKVCQVNGSTVTGPVRGGAIDASGQFWAYNRKTGPGETRNGYITRASDGDGYTEVPNIEGGKWHLNVHEGGHDGTQFDGHLHEGGPGRGSK